MRFIAVDIGNTRLKLGLFESGGGAPHSKTSRKRINKETRKAGKMVLHGFMDSLFNSLFNQDRSAFAS